MASFQRLVRFLAKDGHTYYGDAILPSGVTDISKAKQAYILKGDVLSDYKVTDDLADIRLLLSPLAPDKIRTVWCLGTNYEKHANESKLPIPQYPLVFYKPSSAVSGPVDPIPIHAKAQEGEGLDYECELVVVVGKKCVDVPESRALDHVLGYAIGNDVSHREWQLKRGGGQWSLGKGFDGWAPFGPGIVSTSEIPDPQKLRITTRLNGTTVQDDNTADMIFTVKKTIAFLSQGMTLMPGDLIFTGTPAGVIMGRDPKVWLKDGDVVEVELENVGTCTNKVEFASSPGKSNL